MRLLHHVLRLHLLRLHLLLLLVLRLLLLPLHLELPLLQLLQFGWPLLLLRLQGESVLRLFLLLLLLLTHALLQLLLLSVRRQPATQRLSLLLPIASPAELLLAMRVFAVRAEDADAGGYEVEAPSRAVKVGLGNELVLPVGEATSLATPTGAQREVLAQPRTAQSIGLLRRNKEAEAGLLRGADSERRLCIQRRRNGRY
mmetsp:Transcript_29436/g.85451  ORF Transcript_29436/g.85451 Transcript_29436/m.85451 type:complete len:200 (-) Transcript_29436:229-828(-)